MTEIVRALPRPTAHVRVGVVSRMGGGTAIFQSHSIIAFAKYPKCYGAFHRSESKCNTRASRAKIAVGDSKFGNGRRLMAETKRNAAPDFEATASMKT
jgi:hypothetical protein